MTYLKALTFFFNRLETKDLEKGESFREWTNEEVRDLLYEEITEWKSASSMNDQITELTDIMVCCVLLIERMMQE